MNETMTLIVTFIAGISLGLLFFGGLWFTVKKTLTSKKPAWWVLGSFVARMALVLLGFYFIGAGSLNRFLITLSGFIIARFLVAYLTKEKQEIIKKEVKHES
jgi:F1F0 ATPase subunit 2